MGKRGSWGRSRRGNFPLFLFREKEHTQMSITATLTLPHPRKTLN